jgi:hypothetical protein
MALNMTATDERRIKCSTCGYELTYPEFVHGDKCAFHAELPTINFFGWIKFAITELRIYNLKRRHKAHGYDAEMFYKACLGNCQNKGDISSLTNHKEMDILFNKLAKYIPESNG